MPYGPTRHVLSPYGLVGMGCHTRRKSFIYIDVSHIVCSCVNASMLLGSSRQFLWNRPYRHASRNHLGLIWNYWLTLEAFTTVNLQDDHIWRFCDADRSARCENLV